MLTRTEVRRLYFAAVNFRDRLTNVPAEVDKRFAEAFEHFASDRSESAADEIVQALREITAMADRQLTVDLLDITDSIVNPDKGPSTLGELVGTNRIALISFTGGSYPRAVELCLDVFTGMIDA